jgi:hypothetical protein
MRSSSTASQKPAAKEEKRPIMKIIVEIFARKKKGEPRRRTETVELLTTWTTRDWADLPVHHPRQD